MCTIEYFREPFTDNRVRFDPLDPKTSRHFGAWEFVGETDPAKLRYILKSQGRLGPGWSAVRATPAGRFRTTPRLSGDADSCRAATSLVAAAVPTWARDVDYSASTRQGRSPRNQRSEALPQPRSMSHIQMSCAMLAGSSISSPARYPSSHTGNRASFTFPLWTR